MSSIYPERKYVIYKTTNLINGRWYIGRRILRSENDPYLGSGKLLKQAIRKHGKENFKREFLHVYDDYQSMIDKERELVNEDVINDSMSYNISFGGLSARLFGKDNGMYGHTHKKSTKRKMSCKATNRKRTVLSRLKQSISAQGKQKGERNSQSKLTQKDVCDIKKELMSGTKQETIAQKYNITQPHVSDIKNGKRWK